MKIYGLIGYPVRHSLSPAMHNAAFAAAKIDAQYRLFAIRPIELKKFLLEGGTSIVDANDQIVNANDILGFNVTIPHKIATKEILDKAYPDYYKARSIRNSWFVQICGAVNTVIKRDTAKYGPVLEYHNTDGLGFCQSLKEDLQFNPKGKKVLLLGCGGAGRSVVGGLTWSDESVDKIYIYEEDEMTMRIIDDHFKAIEDKFEVISKKLIPEVIGDCSLLVNATPLGMRDGDPSPIDKELLFSNLAVYDVVYNRQTQLVIDANNKGCRAVTGLGMLLHQGVKAWELWTGIEAPIDVMRQSLKIAMEE
ncbi:MAG: shikimate dehydrogenase [Candidatus Omnitrophica bacterium]|nr:shikimate dehydrogenase [Candidatus Omnitrophota bacterium]